MSLPYDIARCEGVQAEGHWRRGCKDCLRRTSPGDSVRQLYIVPPAIVVFECESRIEPKERTE